MDGQQSGQNSDEPTWQFKPGETVSPRQQAPAPAPVAPAKDEPVPAKTAPAPVEAPASPEPVQQPAVSVSEPTPQLPPPAATPAPEPIESSGPADYADGGEYISWTASEFIAHDKTAGWHIGLIAVAVVIAAIVWLVTRDVITSGVVVVAGVVLSLYGSRRPGELQYQMDSHGLSIGQKHFSFNDFRAFSVMPEGAFSSISLVPTKRFAPMTTLYYAPEDEDNILDMLGSHLPQQPMRADAIDSLMRKIRF